ncbi:outer membrane protein assembly factor BamE [Achromobacter seleniivolatilans]|uniref:Outer membrane protein assembly factor BamE n=1 Tax=Achromobacter seleniivolatilans TaxID=3047478 RepID=A0ABY9M266_9BURK|nr:OmpA family protein [Achromobacter sp. R39]WMD20790.1 outer membrane protein assembly factor BamE [Achromobacter sp. R39]
MKINNKWTARALAAAVFTLLQACSAPSPTASPTGDAAQSFPAPEKAWPKEGSFPNPENLRLLRDGMTKDQLYGLLGRPHFNEGFFNVREWNYLLQISADGTPQGQVVTCQLKVLFDEGMRAASYHWKPANCATPTPAAPLRAHAPTPQMLKRAVLSGDVLFSFNGSTLNDITPQGRQQLERLARELSAVKNITRIEISAYTDRLGSDSYNMVLSQKRAMAIQSLMVRAGIDATVIQARGLGKSSPPLSQCGPMPKAALIECTAPDRRVEIQVFGVS